MKNILMYLVVTVTVLTSASVTVVAEDAIRINGGGQTVLMKEPSVLIQRAYHVDPKLKTIYNNLGTGTDVYEKEAGWTISGSDSEAGEEWTQGSAFTPKANATVTEVQVGFSWESGPNSGTIALYADKKGVPGKVLHTFKSVNNLPTFGDTTTILQTVKVAKGIKVKKETQYWVVLSSPTTSWDVWNWANYAMGPEAYNNGNGWTVRTYMLGAFAVLGK